MEPMNARVVGIWCYPEIHEVRCDICDAVLASGRFAVWFQIESRSYAVVNTPTSSCCGKEKEFRQLFRDMEDAQKAAREVQKILQGGGDPFKWRYTKVPEFTEAPVH
jgi:hypothetical protein